MTRFVLDASVAMAWCFQGQGGDHARKVLALLRTSEAVVPAIWPLEIANSVLVAERKRRLAPADVVRFLDLLEGLSVEVDAFTAGKALGETLRIARERNLSAYDAAYLELAMREALPLATLDEALRKAAQGAGVRIVA